MTIVPCQCTWAQGIENGAVKEKRQKTEGKDEDGKNQLTACMEPLEPA